MPPRRKIVPRADDSGSEDEGDGPSLAQAEKFRQLNMVQDEQGKAYPLYKTRVRVLAKYGIGVTLYFSFVKSICRLFLVLSIIYFPALVLNWYGDGQGTGYLTKSTLGNLGTESNSTTIPYIGTYEKRESSLIVAMLDLLACLYFFVHTSFFRWRLSRAIAATDAGQVTPSDYSVVVYGLPRDVERNEVREFFTDHYGRVAEVEFGVNNSASLGNLFLRGKLRMKLADLQAKVKRLESMGGTANEMLAQLFFERIDETEVKLLNLRRERMELAKGTRKEVCVAFVVFEHEADFLDCITDYHNSKYWSTRVLQPDRLRFQRKPKAPDVELQPGEAPPPPPPKHKLSVSIAPEPSEVVWEHLEAGPWRRRKLGVRVNLVAMMILLCSFAIVFEAKKYQSLQQKIANTLCPAAGINATQVDLCAGRDPGYCLADQWGGCGIDEEDEPFTAYYNPDKDPEIIPLGEDCSVSDYQTYTFNCYCRTLGEVALNAAAVCRSYVANQALSSVVLFFSSISVVWVNIWIKGVLTRLTRHEMHHTVSSEMRSVFYKVLVAQFMNTCALSIISTTNIEYTFPSVRASLALLGRGLGDGDYADFNEAWYLNTGSFLQNTLIKNVVTFCIPILVLLPKTRFKLWRLRRAHRTNTLLIGTQHGLNMRLLGPPFKLSIRYAQVVSAVWIVFGFCPGLPLLPVIGLGVLGVAYWVDKYALLYLYRKPPFYDESLPRAAISAVPVALMLHIMTGIWMLGREDLTGNESIASTLETYTDSYGFDFNSTAAGIFDEKASLTAQVKFKMLRTNTIHLTVLAGLFFIGWLAWNVAGKWLTRVACIAFKGRQVFYEAEGVPPFTEGQEVMRKAQVLNTYNIKSNLNYRELFLRSD